MSLCLLQNFICWTCSAFRWVTVSLIHRVQNWAGASLDATRQEFSFNILIGQRNSSHKDESSVSCCCKPVWQGESLKIQQHCCPVFPRWPCPDVHRPTFSRYRSFIMWYRFFETDHLVWLVSRLKDYQAIMFYFSVSEAELGFEQAGQVCLHTLVRPLRHAQECRVQNRRRCRSADVSIWPDWVQVHQVSAQTYLVYLFIFHLFWKNIFYYCY